MSKPVCLVTGVGPETGTGAEVAKRFSEDGYQVAMLARNTENLEALAAKYEHTRAYPCDVADLDALLETIARVKAELGAPAVVVHNALRATRGSILEMDPADLEKNFRVNTTALLHLARETVPAMVEAGKGAILVTGNTSATRGKANWGFFASTKAAQRILAESIAREFGPKGIHVAYFMIDAAIDTPRTRPTLAPDKTGTNSSLSLRPSPRRCTALPTRTVRPGPSWSSSALRRILVDGAIVENDRFWLQATIVDGRSFRPFHGAVGSMWVSSASTQRLGPFSFATAYGPEMTLDRRRTPSLE